MRRLAAASVFLLSCAGEAAGLLWSLEVLTPHIKTKMLIYKDIITGKRANVLRLLVDENCLSGFGLVSHFYDPVLVRLAA